MSEAACWDFHIRPRWGGMPGRTGLCRAAGANLLGRTEAVPGQEASRTLIMHFMPASALGERSSQSTWRCQLGVF